MTSANMKSTNMKSNNTSTNAANATRAKTQMPLEKVCEMADLIDNSGVCALVNGVQVAIFKLSNSAGQTSVYALSNWDPIGKANVMYRGIIGSIADEPVICSPLYKQHYSLITGACFENEDAQLSVYQCDLKGQDVFLGLVVAKPVAA